MDVITRDIISNNFIATELQSNNKFNKADLNNKIDLWKYILKYQCNAQRGESILIGMQVLNINYLAACFAAAELSLKIVIVDYTRNDEFEDLEYFDPKTKILSPIDIFLYDLSKEHIKKYPKELTKFTFFSNCSLRTYSTCDDINFKILNVDDFNLAANIFPDPSDVVMRCTSSGTTGTPKIVEHTHEFLSNISYRNSHKFSGNCVHIKNLNHGSSLAVYFLPTLISNDVAEHLFYDLDEEDSFDIFVNNMSRFKDTLKYIIFPYPSMIDKFINASIKHNINWPVLNIQTLSYIQDSSKDAIKNNIFKSITSIFGSNETSGPVFESYVDINSIKQDSQQFTKPDNFYNIRLREAGLLSVTLPFYNSEIITNDIFEENDNYYIHKGRSDLVKIDGEILDIKIINDLNLKNKDLYVITDTVKNCLYLAFWDSKNSQLELNYTNFFKNNFKKVAIKKTAVLDKNKFLTGIKLDNELLREYFRNHV